MTKGKWIVYQITNLLNSMVYVGVHHNKHVDPYKFDGYLGSSIYLQNAINKYGKDSFKRKTLFIFDTPKEAYKKEAKIVTPEFVARRDNYNLKTGGLGSGSGEDNPFWGKHPSEEARRKMSMVSHRGKDNPMFGGHHSEETKKKMSKSRSGENNPNYGKHFSVEHRRKISESKKLPKEVVDKRLLDIKNEPKVWGWKTRLSEKWGVHPTTVGVFLKNIFL